MSSPSQFPGAQCADALVVALAKKNPPVYAVPVCTMGQLPPALITLQTAIHDRPGDTVAGILMTTIRPKAVLRKSFLLQPAAPKGKADRQQTVFRNMANGAGEYAFDLPGMQLCVFMADLFKAIASKYKMIEFNERDLFHGHTVPNEAARDIVIVFHAKEYPNEEFPQGKRNMWNELNLLSKVADFDLNSPMMTQRSFIWTLSTNTIFLLTDPDRTTPSKANADFACLIQPSNKKTLELKDCKAGTVQEGYFGTELMSVNYFPNHVTGGDDEHIFFTPNAGGGWGPLLYLESLYPKIDPKLIEATYKKTGTSLNQTIEILSKM